MRGEVQKVLEFHIAVPSLSPRCNYHNCLYAFERSGQWMKAFLEELTLLYLYTLV